MGKMTVIARPAAILAAALALAACGGSAEREALRTYEASVERLMEEDGKVGARLADLREDLLLDGAATEAMGAYSRAEAAPFYARFREAAAKAPAQAERLAKVHALLLEYIDHRAAYLAAIDGFLAADRGGGMARLQKAQSAWDAANRELESKAGGQLTDPGALDAMNRRIQFMQARFNAFQQGKIPVEDVEEALRNDLLPRLQKVAERSRANLTAEGTPGVVARWAAAELAFFQELAATLPLLSSVQKSAQASQTEWDGAAEVRARYIAALRAYRDSLR